MNSATNDSQGFWSYVHDDDEAEGERISKLARDVVQQYEMITGDKINLFLDKDAIKWGDEWRDKIDEGLATVAFFIPVLTPRYLMSPGCRRELQFFVRRSSNLGISELVLPLLYLDVPKFLDEDCEDDLVIMIRKFQYVDWRALRFSELSSQEYRRNVAELAERLVEANRKTEETALAEISGNVAASMEEELDSTPGFIDRIASAEEALPMWGTALEGIGNEIEEIGVIMREATDQLNDPKIGGSTFARRLKIAREMAGKLVDPTDRIWSLGNDFATHLHDVDEGFRLIIEYGAKEAQSDPDSKENICEFFSTVLNLSSAAKESFGVMQGMVDNLGPIEKMSRDVRPPLRRFRQGMKIFIEAREISDEWVRLIEESGLDCDEPSAE